MTIKAIETSYAGCRFRSRLEARWAVFFDHMQIPWEHEPEGFETPDGRYLPDFRLLLQTGQAWFEVKPDLAWPLTTRSARIDDIPEIDPRWHHVAETAPFFTAFGMPKVNRQIIESRLNNYDGFPGSDFDSRLVRVWPSGEVNGFQFFTRCDICDKTRITWAGEQDCCKAKLRGHYQAFLYSIADAYAAARSERFSS